MSCLNFRDSDLPHVLDGFEPAFAVAPHQADACSWRGN